MSTLQQITYEDSQAPWYW